MQTRFEHFAVTALMGTDESPPRRNGELRFRRLWEERAFGMAIALSKKGDFEWEEFRQSLIDAIAEWEGDRCKDRPSWDYYERWLSALERLVLDTDMIGAEELDARTVAIRQRDGVPSGAPGSPATEGHACSAEARR